MKDTLLPSQELLIDDDHFCELCNHPLLEKARYFYFEWMNNTRIARMCKIPEADVESHALAYAWDMDRSGYTIGWYRATIREVGPLLLLNKEKIPPKVVAYVAKQLDIVMGNEKSKQRNETTDLERTVNLINREMTGLIKQGYDAEEVWERYRKMMPESLMKLLVKGKDGLPQEVKVE